MTMSELARLANVSVATVSKAFNNSKEISPQTKERIFELAKELGCYGKYYKNKFYKKVIAIICPEFISEYYTGFLEGLRKIIEDNDGIAIISADSFEDNKQAELMEYFSSYMQVDGIFVLGNKTQIKRGYDTPVISIFYSSNPDVDQITVDLTTPIREAVKFLGDLGHKNIAFFGETLTKGKANIFVDSMKNIRDSKATVIESEFRFEKAGVDASKRLLSESKDCTAIICAYDNIAYGAIKHLKSKGYRVPEDFSVIGMDNINFSEYTETPLSSIDSHTEEICKKAWELMENKFKNSYYRALSPIVVKGDFIIKGTVAKPRKN